MSEHEAAFTEHRGAVFGAAYRILGSTHDAEDVVQETWLRWSGVEPAGVREPRAYLVRTASRLALNVARAQSRRRESYVGPWLPEPVATGPDGERAAELAESVSMAMLVVLASLSPLERAAFVLREVFDLPVPEIASTLDRSEAAVRQLVHRARQHVSARAPRHPVDRDTHRQVTERFLRAASTGAVAELVSLLSPDVVLTTDGGGVKRAALRPIHGPDKVLRFLGSVLAGPGAAGLDIRLAEVNGRPAIVGYADGVVDSVGIVDLDGGVVTSIYLLRNPEKLAGLALG